MATTTPNFGWAVPTSTDLVKDGAVAIETLGDAIDASLVDLKGGTSGQVLKKNSNTDMDFVWSADSAGMTNPMTTTGDTIYSSSGSTPARLGIGSTGQVLTVASGVPSWASPAGSPSLNYQLLNTGGTALTGAQNITISGITSKALLIEVVDASSVLAASYMRIKLNNEDNCSTVIWNALDTTLRQAVTDNSIPFGQTGNSAADKVSGVLSVYSADAAGKKPLNFTGAASGTGRYTYWGSGFYNGSAVTSVVFNSSDGNFDAGTIYVYGAA
jgi:hypothetical protein